MILPSLRKNLSLSTNTMVLNWCRRKSSSSPNKILATPRLKEIYSATKPIILPPHIVLKVRLKIRMVVSLIFIQQLDWIWKYLISNRASLIPPLGIWSSVTSPIKKKYKGKRGRRRSVSSASRLGTPIATQESSTTRRSWNSLWIKTTWPWGWQCWMRRNMWIQRSRQLRRLRRPQIWKKIK